MKAAEREEARKYYVEYLYSIKTILKIMGKKVSRKSLYNWLNEDNWRAQRKEYLKKTKSLREAVFQLSSVAIAEAIEEPDDMSIFAAAKMIGAMETFKNAQLDDFGHPELKDEKKKKNLSDETLKKFKKALGLE